jgi:hypothetical protein
MVVGSIFVTSLERTGIIVVLANWVASSILWLLF